MSNVEKSEKAIVPMLFPCAPDQFLEQIRLIVREEIKRQEKNPPTKVLYETPRLTQKPLYKIAEVCQLFQVTKPTIHAWVRSGKLRSVKVKSRVFFLRHDLVKLLFPEAQQGDETNFLS